jgi:serine protease Do
MSRLMSVTVWGMLAIGVSLARAQDPSPPAGGDREAITALERQVVEVIAAAEPSVVAIARVRKDRREARADLFDVLPGRMANPASQPDFTPQEYATGVVIDPAGLIVTTYHVLGDIAKNDYFVTLDRTSHTATVLAADPWLDLAVLKIEAEGLKPIRWGDAASLKKGQFVIAMGNPHAIAKDGKASARWGIVANLERTAALPRPRAAKAETIYHYGSLIEVDAHLERGASGGPLLNLDGEMVGLTTTFVPHPEVAVAGGLVIPVNASFKAALEKLKSGRQAEFGFLGVGMGNVQEPSGLRRGARVVSVVRGTPAFSAGAREGDIITHVDETEVEDANHLIMLLGRMPAEAEVRLTIERPDFAGRSITVREAITLSKRYMDTLRPAYATVVDPPWRGLTVDFVTAIPEFDLRAGRIDREGCVGVLDVERNSPAWKAGLRPGMFISHVDDQRVTTPAALREAVEDRPGEVSLRLTEVIGKSSTVAVPPP